MSEFRGWQMDYEAVVLERVAQRFRRDMWESVVPEAVTESGVEVDGFGPVQVTAFADLPEAHSLNQIQGAAEPGAIEEGHLAEAVEWMRAREVDYRIPVAEPRPGAAQAASWLGVRGYERGAAWIKLVRDGSPPDIPADPRIEIYELGDYEDDGEGLSAIVAEALKLPVTAGALFFSLPQKAGWRCYTAALGPDEPVVATASMMICDGIAQLGPGNTLACGRGRGCNTQLLRRRLLDAAAAGCHTVFVELGETKPEWIAAAYRNLQRAGFEEAYRSHNWQRPALHPAQVY